jgi:hypothetical protein
MHCCALAVLNRISTADVSSLVALNKRLFFNTLHEKHGGQAEVLSFGAASASLRCNKEAANSSNDLHSLLFSVSLLMPFWPSERRLASSFLIIAHHFEAS